MHLNERISIEDARDNVHHLLHKDNPTKFPMGAEYASAVELAITMCSLSKPISTSEFECIACGHTTPSRSEISYFVELQHAALGIQKSDTIAKILGRLMSMPSNRTCTECKGAIQKNTYVEVALELLVLHLPCADVKINQKMKFCGQTMHLRGVVYYGSHHYTSRIIDTGGQVWFHDGMITGKDMCSQGSVTKLKPKDFTKCNSRKIALLVYTQP